MDKESVCLEWHSFSKHLEAMMKDMILNDDFSDVTFVTEDRKQIKSYKNILSACSPFFKEILQIEKGSNSIIFLRGINYSEVESLLQFIHLGKATVVEDRLDEFLNVARLLEIKRVFNEESNLPDSDKDELSPSDQAIGVLNFVR